MSCMSAAIHLNETSGSFNFTLLIYHWKAVVSTHITWAAISMIYLLFIFNLKLARL